MPFSFIFFGVIFIILNFNQNLTVKQKIIYSCVLLLLLFSYFCNISINLKYLRINLIPFLIFFVFIIYIRVVSKGIKKKQIYLLSLLYGIIYLIIINLNLKVNYEFNYIFIAIIVSILNLVNFTNLKSLVFGLGVTYLFLEICNCYFFVMEFEYATFFTLNFLNVFTLSMCIDLILFYGFIILNKYAKSRKGKMRL